MSGMRQEAGGRKAQAQVRRASPVARGVPGGSGGRDLASQEIAGRKAAQQDICARATSAARETAQDAGGAAEAAPDLHRALRGFLSEMKGFQNDVTTQLQATEERMTMLDRKSQFAMRRPALATASDVEAPHRSAFETYLRSGDDDALRGIDLEGKALSSAVAADGGYLVDPQTAETVKSALSSTASIRAVAQVVTVEAGSFDVLVDRGEMGSGWASESGASVETDTGQVERISIPLHELSAMPKAWLDRWPFISNSFATMATAGLPFFSKKSVSWTIHDVHDPQSPLDPTNTSHSPSASSSRSGAQGKLPLYLVTVTSGYRLISCSPTRSRATSPPRLAFHINPTFLPARDGERGAAQNPSSSPCMTASGARTSNVYIPDLRDIYRHQWNG